VLRRFLIIGLGGSGGKTVRGARHDIGQRLHNAGYRDGIPAGWQFLWFDVPAIPEEGELPVPQLPVDGYVGLVSQDVTYTDIHNNIATVPHAAEGLANWQPSPPSEVSIPLSVGAGQFRGIGRTVSLARLDAIAAAIRKSKERMEGAGALAELKRIGSVLDPHSSDAGGTPPPIAIIISSIAGGAGSGLLIDVADLLRDITGGDGHWGDTSIGFLYAPDVFSSIPETQRAGVQPNALATLAEVLGGYWSQTEADSAESAFFAAAGVGELIGRRHGPGRPFLIGSSNGAMRFDTQDDVYEAIGRLLGAWVTSETIQENLENYVGANWTSNAMALSSNTGLLPPGAIPNPFSAAGYARAALGRDRFATYASERIARGAVDRLLRAHWDGRNVPDEKTDEAALREVVDARFGEFQLHSGLDQFGERNNQISDAIRPVDRDTRLAGYEADIKARATHNVASDTGDNFVHRLAGAFEDVRDRFMIEEREALFAAARRWVVEIQDSYVEHVARNVAKFGGPVVAAMLVHQEHNLQEIHDELRNEASQHLAWAGMYREGVSEVVATSAKITADNPTLAQGAKRAGKALGWRAEAELQELCAELGLDLRDNLVAPLRRALQRGVEDLTERDGNAAEAVAGVPIEVWSTGDPPRRLRESPNEFFVNPVAGFPTAFDEQLARTEADDPGTAESSAVSAVLCPKNVVELVRRINRWIPERMEARQNADEAPHEARFGFLMTPGDLLERANAYVRHPNTAIGRYVAEGLRSYLSDEKVAPEEHRRRLDLYRGALSGALRTSRPLVAIDPGMMMKIHGTGDISVLPLITPLPFSESHPGYAVSMNLLLDEGELSREEAEKLFGDSESAAIEISTFLANPLDTPVFSSVVGPIGEDWEKVNATRNGQKRFWQWRRTRHLPAFAPLPSEARRAMVRGWFTARLMDQIDETNTGPDGAKKLLIEIPGATDKAEFPSPLLTPRPARSDLMAAVIESVPLALLTTARADSYRSAYARLVRLGSVDVTGQDTYVSVNAELGWWLRSGSPLEGRYEHAIERLERWLKNYREVFEPPAVSDPRDGFRRPLAWELRADTESVLLELADAIRRAHGEDVSDTDAFA
jgi:hypothetical protein